MRFAIMAAAFGLLSAVNMMAPAAVMNQAVAQAASTVVSPQETALQAQIVALAQAGDTVGLQTLINTQVAAGNSAMLARVAKRVAAQGVSLASVDTVGAAALATAAVAIASNSSVSSSDSTVAQEVGDSAANVGNTIQATDPQSASSLQIAVATSPNVNLQIAYVNFTPPQQQQAGSTTPQIFSPVVRRRAPPQPQEPVVPTVPEPNPVQAGSST